MSLPAELKICVPPGDTYSGTIFVPERTIRISTTMSCPSRRGRRREQQRAPLRSPRTRGAVIWRGRQHCHRLGLRLPQHPAEEAPLCEQRLEPGRVEAHKLSRRKGRDAAVDSSRPSASLSPLSARPAAFAARLLLARRVEELRLLRRGDDLNADRKLAQ